MNYILAIDQGTTSTRAIIFGPDMTPLFIEQEEFKQYFPTSGWVEHNPIDLWETTLKTCKLVLKKNNLDSKSVRAIGITNQRETTIVWDKRTGKPISNAIVWQDRRTANICRELINSGYAESIQQKTGLVIDPYFSATKLKWILENSEGAYNLARDGHLIFGTVDTYLIWKLTNGKSHVTDATNAARTMLFDIRKNCWDLEICNLLNIPIQMLPDVLDCAADFGIVCRDYFGSEIPVLGVAGDQQAATLGQACFKPGMVKSTYGTGCFALLNTGNVVIKSKNRLLSTIAYRLNGETTYALEGSIFVAGAVVQWLRDKMAFFESASDSESLAQSANIEESIYFVPAFTGLGAPHWKPGVRGAIYGLTRNSGPADITKAALESVAYQTLDLLDAMDSDFSTMGKINRVIRVDGGMANSNWVMQFLSNIINAPVDRPKFLEATALGVAWLAGMRAGIYPEKKEFEKKWELQKRFTPCITAEERKRLHKGWKKAIKRTLIN